ncbi:MAG: long-chain fatty acid--CoA ligase, partial [Actinomycetia bacterium]|nr:long-chain fatty acid--CoA ligase [Actinomycetes bacterium]
MGSGGTATNDFATCVTSRAREDPDAVAVVAGRRAISYEELEARIRRAETALSFRGINERDRVAVCSVNRIEIVELLFACCRLGATLVVINNRLTSAEISTQLDDCRPSLVLTEVGFMD